jgi:hypothetical protein
MANDPHWANKGPLGWTITGLTIGAVSLILIADVVLYYVVRQDPSRR